MIPLLELTANVIFSHTFRIKKLTLVKVVPWEAWHKK